MLRCSFNLQEPLSVFLLSIVCTMHVNSHRLLLLSLSLGFGGAAWACGSAAENVKELIVNQS